MPKAFIVVDLGYGDAGKGSMVDYLTKEHGATWNIRFSGGSQCGHNVVLPDGTHHEFRQFGSGTFHGAKTLMTKTGMMNPIMLLEEAAALEGLGVENPLSLYHIHHYTPLTTPFHVAANRLKEIARAGERHGSTGQGIWETMRTHQDGYRFRLREVQLGDTQIMLANQIAEIRRSLASDLAELLDPDQVRKLMATPDAEVFQREEEVAEDFLEATNQVLSEVRIMEQNTSLPGFLNLGADEVVVCEGSQGICLSENYNSDRRYLSATNTTSAHPRTMLSGYMNQEVVAVTRTYQVRHGEGPFEEVPSLTDEMEEPYNVNNRWQGGFRAGWLDFRLLYNAWTFDGGSAKLAITHMDREFPEQLQVKKYNGDFVPLESTERIGEQLSGQLGFALLPKYLSYGPTYDDKKVVTPEGAYV